MDIQPLATMVVTLTGGVSSLVLGSKTKLPSVLFFLTIGVLAGPQFLGMIRPDVFAEELPEYISLMVALILFEGAASLKSSQFKEISRSLRNLLTIGIIISLVGITLTARFTVQMNWTKALLFGGIMIVTGPTVVIPILQRNQIKPNIHNLLKWEAILIDPLGVVIAIVLFELLILEQVDFFLGVKLFIGRLVVGALIGIFCGWFMHQCLTRKRLMRLESDELGGLFVIAATLFFYSIAEWTFKESGLVASTAAGIYFGNQTFPHKNSIFHFKKQVTLLALSCLFIILAAGIPFFSLQRTFLEGNIILFFMIFIIRPAAVLISTYGDSSFTFRDRLFISFFAPRGIVSASLASLFVIAFEQHNLIGRGVFLPLAFHVISGSILFYSLASGIMAQWLRVSIISRPGVILIGVNALSLAAARAISGRGFPVQFIDSNRTAASRAGTEGFPVVHGSALDEQTISMLNVKNFAILLALTSNPELNLLCCQRYSGLIQGSSLYRLGLTDEDLSPRNSEDVQGQILYGLANLIQDPEFDRLLSKDGLTAETRVLDQEIELVDRSFSIKETPLFSESTNGLKFLSPGEKIPQGAKVTYLRSHFPASKNG